MAFNSIEFLIFLPVVYSLYRLLNLRWQNLMLLTASYLFYGWWDERFLFLIVLSTAIDYGSALMIEEGKVPRRARLGLSVWVLLSAIGFVGLNWQGDLLAITPQGWWVCLGMAVVVGLAHLLYPMFCRLSPSKRRGVFLFISMAANLTMLGFFKYFNFFIDSAEQMVSTLGVTASSLRLNIVLPVGISFYTFQTMSYTIDVYQRKMKPTHRFLDFALFVSFFPQLVAGPIERASHLLPRILNPRTITFDQSMRGLFLILLGLFKKVGVADSLAGSVDSIFLAGSPVGPLDIMAATALFAVQIYCDFSGYSDIARGTSKLLGIDLMVNFRIPYASATPSEFWERWHISLSSWLRDYLYIPLGGSRGKPSMVYRNLMLTMLLGGLWHGAAWNFVLWGAYQGAILCIYRALGITQTFQSRLGKTLQIGFFFVLTCYGWLLFRAVSFAQILDFTQTLAMGWGDLSLSIHKPTLAGIVGLMVLLFYELCEHGSGNTLFYRRLPSVVRGGLYAVMVFVILLGTSNAPVQFIYFQF